MLRTSFQTSAVLYAFTDDAGTYIVNSVPEYKALTFPKVGGVVALIVMETIELVCA